MITPQLNNLNKPFQIPDVHSLECTSDNGCLSLHRTNTRMSGNHKLVHKSDTELYIESIPSDDYLSRSMFKAYTIDTNQTYMFNIQQFFKQSSKNDSIWKVKIEEQTKGQNFTEQYQNLYRWGAYTEINDLIGNNFRFFAPLWTYGKLPDRFLIFKTKNNSYSTVREYIDNCQLVKSVDMTTGSSFGRYLRTLTTNTDFKDHCIYGNYGNSEMRYYGIDINSGKFKYYAESDLDSYLANERTITEFNNAITNGWKRGELLCPNILNLEFSFDDTTANEGFNNYIGVYCFDNEISKADADALQQKSGTVVLNYTEDDIKLYRGNINTLTPFTDYKKIIKTATVLQTKKTELPPIIEITLSYSPVPSSVLSIEYDNIRELDIYMIGDILNASNTDEVLELIAEKINNANIENLILTASVVNSVLIIKSQLTLEEYENVTINLPPVFEVKKPKYYTDVTNISNNKLYSSLKMITMQDLIVSTESFSNDIEFVEIDNVDYTMIKSFVYRKANVIRLDESFSLVGELNSNVITFKKICKSRYSIESFVKHCDFDLTMLTSPYYDIYDFDMLTYQQTFGKQMETIFRRYDANTHSQLDLEIIAAYRSYFKFPADVDIKTLYQITSADDFIVTRNTLIDNIPQKEVLINMFDEFTLYPSSTCKNEFLRLSEKTLTEIRNVNVLEPLVTKFACINGLDSYNNPITLNIGLPWRNDNFLSSNYRNRSVINNTHSWFIMASGPAPYIKKNGLFEPEMYLNNIQKQLGYANVPYVQTNNYHSITLNTLNNSYDPTSNSFDVFELLKYKMNDVPAMEEYYSKHAYSYMFSITGTNYYHAIFRGIEYVFEGSYSGYRFAVILVTEPNTDKNNTTTSPFNLVDNVKYKTLTLVINFYVADKLLTSLNDSLPYYLDRSFFYYTDKVYLPSKQNSINELTNGELISLNLFDTDTTHYYKSTAITYKQKLDRLRTTNNDALLKTLNNWYTIDETGKPIFCITLNQLNSTGGNAQQFTEIINTNTVDPIKKFEWLYVTELHDSSVSMLIRFTAYDIVDIKDDIIWCRDIFTEFIINNVYLEDYDSNGAKKSITLSIDDIIANNSPTITINNVTYKIPFWEKISSSKFMNLPINDDKIIRRGLRLTKEFYEELDMDKYIYQSSILPFIKTSTEGKLFVAFDDVYYDSDNDDIKNNKLDIDNLNGMLLENDQYWFMSKGISNSNAMFLNNQPNQAVSKFNYLTSAYVRDLFNMSAIKEFVINIDGEIIDTTTQIEMKQPSSTYIISSLGYDNSSNSLTRLEKKSFIINRLDGYYAPIFKRILQPYTFSYNGNEYIDCMFPKNLIPGYDGRRICTNDNVDNYCEEYIDSRIRNIFNKAFYKAIYDSVESDVIADTALSEYRGFISNTYYNNDTITIKYPYSEIINLVDVTRDTIGKVLLSKYAVGYNIDTDAMIASLKLYNQNLRGSNIVYEDFYDLFYKNFFNEFFCKHYKLTSIIANDYKIDFTYTDFETVKLSKSTVFDESIYTLQMTFTKS